jgi:hypothetical protein
MPLRLFRERIGGGAPQMATSLPAPTTESDTPTELVEDAHTPGPDQQADNDQDDAQNQATTDNRDDSSYNQYHGDQPQDEQHVPLLLTAYFCGTRF